MTIAYSVFLSAAAAKKKMINNPNIPFILFFFCRQRPAAALSPDPIQRQYGRSDASNAFIS